MRNSAISPARNPASPPGSGIRYFPKKTLLESDIPGSPGRDVDGAASPQPADGQQGADRASHTHMHPHAHSGSRSETSSSTGSNASGSANSNASAMRSPAASGKPTSSPAPALTTRSREDHGRKRNGGGLPLPVSAIEGARDTRAAVTIASRAKQREDSDSSLTSPRSIGLPTSPRDIARADLQSPVSPRSPLKLHHDLPAVKKLPHPSDLNAFAELFIITYMGSLPIDDEGRTILQNSVSMAAARGELKLNRDEKYAPYLEQKKNEEKQRSREHHSLIADMLKIPERERVELFPHENEPLFQDAGAREKVVNLSVTVAGVLREEFYNGDAVCVRKFVDFFLEICQRFGPEPAAMELMTIDTRGTPHSPAANDIPGEVKVASPALRTLLEGFSAQLFADGTLLRSAFPRKFLGALRSMDKMALGLCQFAVGENDPRPGRENVETFRRNVLVQFLVTRGISAVFREVCDHCVKLLGTGEEIVIRLNKHFNRTINTACLALVNNIIAKNDDFHSAVLPKLETGKEIEQRQQETIQRQQDRISHFRQRSSQPERKGSKQGIQRRNLDLRGEQRQFRHDLKAFVTWLEITLLAPELQDVLESTMDAHRSFCDFAILQSACHTAALIYRKRNPGLLPDEVQALDTLIDSLHGPVFAAPPSGLSSPEAGEQLPRSARSGRLGRSSRSEQSDRSERSERSEKSDRSERSERSEFSTTSEVSDRSGKNAD